MHHLRKTKKTSLSTPSPSFSFSFSSLNQPSPSSSNHRSTVVAENVTTGGKNSGSAMLKGAGDAQQANTKGRRAHHVTSGQENRDKIHHTHQRKHLSGKQTLPKNLHKYTVKENENGTLTKKVDWRKGAQLTSPPPTDERRLSGAQGQGTQSRPPSDKEGIPATMEAVVRMEVAVGSCSVGREVARLLGKTLKKQELCGTGLTCHNPRHTCKETRDT
ncbi:hypothetical protein E2C01_064016 [Portunus trituberculatus]|uniref:Uncharacterized protein n=1 Tax=Portunus trituberculatus TaxID=210409 RepID=A0A5B7HJQ9_PORTR|nr:hypothetical protein [Portunus trituberculatus]